MYVPRHFAVDDLPTLHGFMAQYGFAYLVTATDGAPVASHLAMMVDASRGEYGTLVGHMSRANPQWREFAAAAGEAEALAIFHGPHAYISPSWYDGQQAVPTWNYTAVHAYGRPRILEDHQAVLALLQNLVAEHESARPEPWSLDSQEADYRDMKISGIVAFEIPISRLEGKFKLNQNKPAADRQGVIAGLRGADDAMAEDVADLMEDAQTRLKD